MREYTQAIAVDPTFQYLLLIKRAYNPGKGLLSGAGGTVEKGETSEECMRREWEEETDIPLDGAKLFPLVTLENTETKNHMFGIILPKIDIYYIRQIGEGIIRWHHIIGCDLLDMKNPSVAWDGAIPYCFNLLKKQSEAKENAVAEGE